MESLVTLFIVLLILHWVGDFFLNYYVFTFNYESDDIGIKFCQHIFVYWLVLGIGLLATEQYAFKGVLVYATLNSFIHSVSDWMTLSMRDFCLERRMPKTYQICFGFNQMVHLGFLIGTSKILFWY